MPAQLFAGHSSDSLEALGAEIVVTFVGNNEVRKMYQIPPLVCMYVWAAT